MRKNKHSLLRSLNPSAQVSNPVDMLGGAEPPEFAHCLETLIDDPEVDVLLPMLVPQSLVNPGDVARAIVEQAKKTDKTILACMVGEQSLTEARQVLHENQIPMSIFPEVPGKVLGAMCSYRSWLEKDRGKVFRFTDTQNAEVQSVLRNASHKALGEAETRPVLKAYGLNLIPGAIAGDADEAASIAEEIGFPVAVKVVSPQILHKSDLGGIALNLADAASVKDAVNAMQDRISAAAPESCH